MLLEPDGDVSVSNAVTALTRRRRSVEAGCAGHFDKKDSLRLARSQETVWHCRREGRCGTSPVALRGRAKTATETRVCMSRATVPKMSVPLSLLAHVHIYRNKNLRYWCLDTY